MNRLGWTEKWTLRFAVVGLLCLAVSGFEGFLMRIQVLDVEILRPMEDMFNMIRPGEDPTQAQLFYSMLSAHPIVGIYGFAYMLVMGAFYFLVPFLVQKEIRYKKLVPVNFWLQIIGVAICWVSGFFGMFCGLYTLYWPLPVAYDRVPVIGSIGFSIGAAFIMVNILLFSYNIFSTVLSKNGKRAYSIWQFVRAAFGWPRLMKLLGREDKTAPNIDYNGLPVFIVAVGRGSIDTVINAFVLLTAGALILVYGIAQFIGAPLDYASVDALIYKNWYWWGLDMVADGNVLMYTAGVWYLLIPILTGRKLFGESVVRTVIMVDLLVSMGVWSHHLLADQPQPLAMRIISGQFITWGEFFTMGLTVFASMMTIWLARPVKLTAPLKFVLASIFGFVMAGSAGLIQANTALNVVFHNTQWVVALHAHGMLLAGLACLLFAVVYAILPMLTKLEIHSQKLVDVHLWLWVPGTVLMTMVMSRAGSLGMLRRTLYDTNTYDPYSIMAIVGTLLVAAGFVVFLYNIIMTLGLMNVISLFVPDRFLKGREKKAEAAA